MIYDILKENKKCGEKMGKLLTRLQEEERRENRSFLTSFTTNEANDEEISILLSRNDKVLLSEDIEALLTVVEQNLGHYNQVVLKVEGYFQEEEYKQLMKQKEVFYQQLTQLKAKQDSQEKLLELQQLKENCRKSYDNMTNIVKKGLKDSKLKREITQEVEEAENNILQLDKLTENTSLSEMVLQRLCVLYRNALDKGVSEDALQERQKALKALNQTLKEQYKVESYAKAKNQVVPDAKQEFDLFSSFNDKIIKNEFLNVQDKILACYQLQDGRYYYAIIPRPEKLSQELPNFKNLARLQLTRTEVEKMLNTILTNAQIYYDLKEYTRYIIFSHKQNITGNIEQAINQYQTSLGQMEQILHSQLKFAESLAPVLNGKTSLSFPNIVYRDTKPKDFYGVLPATQDKTKEQWSQTIISQVLGQDERQIQLTAREILLSIYGSKEVTYLEQVAFKPKEPSSSVTSKTIAMPRVPEVTPGVYLQKRLQTLNQIKEGKEIPQPLPREEKPEFREINTVLDLHTACAISDRIYKEGQGLFAITEFLKTNEVTRFTSKYGARELVMKVNREQYLNLLFENMIKCFANSVKKAKEDSTYMTRMAPVMKAVQEALAYPFQAKEKLLQKIFSDEEVLKLAVQNFDYQFLDKDSKENTILEKALTIGKQQQNSSALKIEEALNQIHS